VLVRGLRLNRSATLAATLGGGIFLTGCATPLEEPLVSQYQETYDSVYKVPDTAESVARPDGNSTFDDYLQHGFAHSPKLRASFDRWKAALERIPQARALDDPELSFEYMIEQHDLRYQTGLRQVFPAFGKLELRNKRAASEAEAAMYTFEADRFMLYDRVAKAFYEYHYLAQSTAITAENLQLLADLENVVTTRYKAGLTPFSDLIKVQVEKDRLDNERATLRDERGAQSSALAALLNLPAHEILPWPKVEPSGQSIIDEAVLAGMLEYLNPELKAADATVAAETYRAKLAQRSFLPDFMLGASWMVMPGMGGKGDENDFGLMAGITLPIWRGKYRAEVREAEADTRAAINEKTDLRNSLRAELSMAVFKTHDAERRISLFSTSLIPKAEQALEVAQQEFSSGKAGFMTLIDAQRTLLEFRLMAERAAVDREIALAEIGCCIGKFNLGSDPAHETEGVTHDTN
jgi:outer membrane protein TolC